MPLLFNTDFLIPLFIFAIPIVAIVGGITAGIVKTISRHRLIELAQRERIAAIERGLDPAKLPVLPDPGTVGGLDRLARLEEGAPFYYNPLHRAQGLMIGGLVTLAAGIGTSVFLHFVADEPGVWAVGIIPGAVGIALLLSAWLVWPRSTSGTMPPAGPPR